MNNISTSQQKIQLFNLKRQKIDYFLVKYS
jgi:hypothetical protein